MKERINWIDWGKALAVTTVVFCHLPQSQDWFYFRYLQTCIISIFFFLSGYLKKSNGSVKENWKKYWYGLILPYIIYNIVIYPYWLAKYYMQNSSSLDIQIFIRPILGALLFEHESTYCEPLNGPLWYLPAILLMHIIVDLCRNNHYKQHVMIILCLFSIFIYAANKFYLFLPNLTFIGIISRLPIYFIGYFMSQKNLFKETNPHKDLVIGLILMVCSIALFQWHLFLFYYGNTSHLLSIDFLLHIALFYPINICFVFGILSICKVLNNHHFEIIVNLSIGTLVIVGLHIVIITIINFIFERLLHIQGVICYQWYEAFLISIAIVAILYPFIYIGKLHLPVLLGRKSPKDISI